MLVKEAWGGLLDHIVTMLSGNHVSLGRGNLDDMRALFCCHAASLDYVLWMWCPWFSVLLISATFVAGVGGMVVCCVRCCVAVTVTWIYLMYFHNWSWNTIYPITYASGFVKFCFVWVEISCCLATSCGLCKQYNQDCSSLTLGQSYDWPRASGVRLLI